MALPVLNVGSANTLTVTGGTPDDNQITLPGGKMVVQLTASSKVTVGFWGPYPAGTVVDPTTRPKPRLLAVCGTNVTVGNDAIADGGNYLVEITAPSTSTVELTVRPWNILDNI